MDFADHSKVCKIQRLITKGGNLKSSQGVVTSNSLPDSAALSQRARFRFIRELSFRLLVLVLCYNVASESSKIDKVLTSDPIFNPDFLCFRLPVL